jgi:hypothetical protein
LDVVKGRWEKREEQRRLGKRGGAEKRMGCDSKYYLM